MRLPANQVGVWVARSILAGVMALGGRTFPRVEVTEIDSDTQRYGRIKGEWARPADAHATGVVLYLHGSGYAACSTRTHRSLVTRFAAGARLDVFSVDYRLAPKYPFPAAVEDVARAWAWLLNQGWRADQIVVAGDSAGGHLAVDLTLQLLRSDDPAPAALVLFSPLVDVTFGLARKREKAMRDPAVSARAARQLLNFYVSRTPPEHPRITHVIAPGETFPPTLIQAGGNEMLAADAHHLHRMLTAAGTDCQLEVWPGQAHVFQALPRFAPEADAALARATRFATEVLETAPIQIDHTGVSA